MREKGTNTFYMFEDWESEELFLADTAMDHVMGFFIEMGAELGTDITMTVRSMKTVPIV